ncbi:MAG: TIGR00730 family Rossman fold protein [Alphaproteobacteria bacterium]
MKQNICVYCGSSSSADDIYYEAARKLGRMIGEKKLRLVYGAGCLGMMGTLADATIKSGGYTIGYTTKLLHEREQAHPNLSELYVVDNLATRKKELVKNSDVFIVLPGGFGTLDELFETLTLMQLSIIDKPICLINVNGYWDHLLKFIKHINKLNFIVSFDESKIQVLQEVEEFERFIENA